MDGEKWRTERESELKVNEELNAESGAQMLTREEHELEDIEAELEQLGSKVRDMLQARGEYVTTRHFPRKPATLEDCFYAIYRAAAEVGWCRLNEGGQR